MGRMMSAGNGQVSVPPGFRFHPTDEELLYYYLRKKVSYEAIDLDVIREVDLNKLEPWDLKDKCRIGSGSENEWYFFSHKDKKYPTGTRTNRATTAGFWKATGRDKTIHLHSNSKRIGLRKTLVFYTGRAPHGHKTDWIMHEYRLDDEYSNDATKSEVQEDGWVVCRVFKKKSHHRSPFQADNHQDHTLYAEEDHNHVVDQDMNKHGHGMHTLHSYNCNITGNPPLFDGSMHLPRLLTSPLEHIPYFPAQHHMVNNNNETGTMMVNDMDCSKNLLSLMSMSHGLDKPFFATSNVTADWTFLDKLLASNQHHPGFTFDQHNQQGTRNDPSSSQDFHPPVANPTSNVFPIHNYLGYETDLLKFSK